MKGWRKTYSSEKHEIAELWSEKKLGLQREESFTQRPEHAFGKGRT